jgi:hypothetical protein
MCWTEILTSYETGGVLLCSWNPLYKKTSYETSNQSELSNNYRIEKLPMRAQNSWAHSHVFFLGGGGWQGRGRGARDRSSRHFCSIYIYWAFSTRKIIYLSSNSKAILKGNPSNKSNFYLQKVYSDEKKENICYGKIMFWHLKKIKFFCGQNYD